MRRPYHAIVVHGPTIGRAQRKTDGPSAPRRVRHPRIRLRSPCLDDGLARFHQVKPDMLLHIAGIIGRTEPGSRSRLPPCTSPAACRAQSRRPATMASAPVMLHEAPIAADEERQRPPAGQAQGGHRPAPHASCEARCARHDRPWTARGALPAPVGAGTPAGGPCRQHGNRCCCSGSRWCFLLQFSNAGSAGCCSTSRHATLGVQGPAKRPRHSASTAGRSWNRAKSST